MKTTCEAKSVQWLKWLKDGSGEIGECEDCGMPVFHESTSSPVIHLKAWVE